jgi:hypothetical protein
MGGILDTQDSGLGVGALHRGLSGTLDEVIGHLGNVGETN